MGWDDIFRIGKELCAKEIALIPKKGNFIGITSAQKSILVNMKLYPEYLPPNNNDTEDLVQRGLLYPSWNGTLLLNWSQIPWSDKKSFFSCEDGVMDKGNAPKPISLVVEEIKYKLGKLPIDVVVEAGDDCVLVGSNGLDLGFCITRNCIDNEDYLGTHLRASWRVFLIAAAEKCREIADEFGDAKAKGDEA
jgi:hypothetical protein